MFSDKDLLKAKDEQIDLLRSFVSSLQSQNKELSERLFRAIQPEPIPQKPVSEMRPLRYDEESKKFIPKTDEEIQNDLRGLQELGIL